MRPLDGPSPRAIRVVAAVVTIACLAVAAVAVVHRSDEDGVVTHTAGTTPVTSASGQRATSMASTSSTMLAAPRPPPGPPSSQRRMTLAYQIGGDISPKSVDASGRGLVFAQNMMYRHTMTVYDSQGHLLKTIPDSVDLAAFGYPRYTGSLYRGAPVELAYSPDGRHAYVSNYSMYGDGFGPEGTDACIDRDSIDSSFVYRLDLRTLAIDQVIAVGKVPKFVATTPDDRYVLVSNWCSYDESVIDTRTGREIRRIPIGPNPRGIAIAPDSSVAYVAEMGGSDIAVIHLSDLTTTWFRGVGSGPRQVVLSPDGRWLYATLNGAGRVVKIDTRTGAVVASVATGTEPRSMAISTDGQSLYVVNYESSTVSKLRASDLSVLQSIATADHPIGITYDARTGDVWVACYVGVIEVFHDR
jgi:YVTN family beta-propeller protein